MSTPYYAIPPFPTGFRRRLGRVDPRQVPADPRAGAGDLRAGAGDLRLTLDSVSYTHLRAHETGAYL
eukprot:3667801-Pyramimonas_sp.AAC.1